MTDIRKATREELWEKHALDETKSLEQANLDLENETKAMLKQLASEQGDLTQYQERQAKAAAKKADMEAQLENAQKQLANKEIARQNMTGDKKKMEGDITIIKKP